MWNSSYFQHDINAQQDPKCVSLIQDYGMEGYGVYWSLIELFHHENGKIKKTDKLYSRLSFRFHVEEALLKQMVEAMLNEYDLIDEDDDFLWSERVLRNLELRRESYEKRAQAGRLGGLKSGKKRIVKQSKQSNAEAKPKQSSSIPKQYSIVKHSNSIEKKEKEIDKEKTSSVNKLIGLFDKVNPSYEKLFGNTSQRAAIERLVKKFGDSKVEQMIITLQQTNNEKYAPTITTPVQLEDKLGNLIAFINKETNVKNKTVKV